MKTIHKAIVKAISVRGAEVLKKKELFCTLLEDLIPELVSERKFIEMVYSDEIGQILTEAALASYSEKDKYYLEADKYLLENNGLIEQKRNEFINIFKSAFRRKTVEVKKFKDYEPALRMLKQKYGETISHETIQCFIEENKLFCRFSITVDDVKRDIKGIHI